jgi:hypothetical protein
VALEAKIGFEILSDLPGRKKDARKKIQQIEAKESNLGLT